MSKIVRTSRAELDLAEIWTYIAQANPDAADRLIRRIDRRLRLLPANPTMGEPMGQFRRGLRATAVGNYVIYYRATEDSIEVYRVLHTARQREDHLQRGAGSCSTVRRRTSTLGWDVQPFRDCPL